MIKNKTGRPQKVNKGRNIIYEVLQSLPQDGTPIRFKDLRENVDMSSSTLSKALFYLCTIGIVEKHQVHSRRGKGIVYQRIYSILGDMESSIKYERNVLINQKEEKEKTAIVSEYEFEHAIHLCYHLGYVDTVIIHALKLYADADKKQKNALLETYLYTINGIITKLLTKLADEPLGMSKFTYTVSSRACEYQLKDIHKYLELVKKTIRVNNNVDEQKVIDFMYEPPPGYINDILMGRRPQMKSK